MFDRSSERYSKFTKTKRADRDRGETRLDMYPAKWK